MDPPAMMTGGGEFRSGNSASSSSLCNLAEILPPFHVGFGGSSVGGNAAASFGWGQSENNGDDDDDGNNNSIHIHAYMNNNGDDDEDPMDLDQRGSNFYSNKKKRREEDDDDDSPKRVPSCSPGISNAMQNNCDGKRLKTENGSSEPKAKACGGSGKRAENHTKPTEPKQDYIHVRARRGQATDSHSLAERARREKISERMKILQDLVPGCNKVIGKALVLDEIINYIQALQRQVEFLSMKLEAVTSRSNLNPQGFPSKELGHQTFEMSFVSQPTTREFSKTSSPEWLHMQIGGSFERTT